MKMKYKINKFLMVANIIILGAIIYLVNAISQSELEPEGKVISISIWAFIALDAIRPLSFIEEVK